MAKVLNGHPGVINAEVSHETNAGTVLTDDTIAIEELVAIVLSTGFSVKA